MGIACDLSVLVHYLGGNNVHLFSLDCSSEGCKVDFYHSVSGMFPLKHVLNETRFYQQWLGYEHLSSTCARAYFLPA